MCIRDSDYRAREANVYRLAEISNAIIDQCVAQGVPFARESVSYTHLRAHETVLDLVCRLLLEKKKNKQ